MAPAHPNAGALDAVGLQRLLEGLGLEPTNRSVATLVQELAVPRTGGQAGWRAGLGVHSVACHCVGPVTVICHACTALSRTAQPQTP